MNEHQHELIHSGGGTVLPPKSVEELAEEQGLLGKHPDYPGLADAVWGQPAEAGDLSVPGHQHEFVHTGGGTFLPTMKADDSYACYCGATLKVENLTPEQHFAMPRRIVLPRVSEGEGI